MSREKPTNSTNFEFQSNIMTKYSTEQIGLQALWWDSRARQSALSRDDSARKRRNQKKKTEENFLIDAFQFARQLFLDSGSGPLTAQIE
ncbi:hypothetical protein PoB_002213700 [Plakobranchus ocellatus]|uniref:Uncharacterized protein n=1 Tax=Plakobranchus ocellatus TaxID=259542 RepID=A0AAV3ZM82_9GAST|nr:hypothetical protein PoB_002213700 [Plakobranchus ocellatus]